MKTGPRFPALWAALLLFVVALGTVLYFVLRTPDAWRYDAVHADFARLLPLVDAYRAQGGRLPEDSDLSFLTPAPLPELPRDPWGHPYRQLFNGREVLLESFGADGERGGGGANQDHTSADGH